MLKDILPVAEQATTEMVKLELTDIENEIVTTTATAVEKISSQLTELGAKKSERDEKINDIYKDLMNTPESATAAAEAKARQDFKIQDKNYIAELTATNKKISENYEKAEKIHKKIAATKKRIEEIEDATAGQGMSGCTIRPCAAVRAYASA